MICAASLMLQVALYGVVLVWLALLIPAAVLTAYKRQWLYFWCGWLTLGATWMVGAVATARTSEVHAEDIEREPRRVRGPGAHAVLIVVGVIVAVACLGLFGARPALLLGMNGRSLQNSVGARSIEPCARVDGEVWQCAVYDRSLSGTIEYRVAVDDFGCWVGQPGQMAAPSLRGCVSLVDYG